MELDCALNANRCADDHSGRVPTVFLEGRAGRGDAVFFTHADSYSFTQMSNTSFTQRVMARFSGVPGTRSLAPRKRTPRWRGATADLIHLSVNQVAGLAAVPFFRLLSFGVYGPTPRAQAPRCASGPRDPNSLIGASLISSQRSSDPLPYGLMLLGARVRSFHFASNQKTRGRDKARGWFRDPPHP